MSFRQAVFVALSAVTLAVAPATAQVKSSDGLSAPLTRVSELVQPSAQPKPEILETEEQFPKVSTLEEQVSVTPVQPSLEVANEGTNKERSQTKSETVAPTQPLEPTRAEQTPEYSFNSQLKLEPFRIVLPQPTQKPSSVVEQIMPSRKPVVFNSKGRLDQPVTMVNQPTVVQQGSSKERSQTVGSNNIAPFSGKHVQLLEPTRATARNNIVPIRQRVVNPVEPSQPVVQTTRETVPVSASPAKPKPESHEGQPSLAQQVTLATRTNERTQTGITTTLETPVSLSREFGTSYPESTPKTTYGLDREFSIPTTVRTQEQNVVAGNDANVHTVSTRAADLGVVTVQPTLQPVVVETRAEAKTEPTPEPKPKGSLSMGVSGIGGDAPVLETSAAIEYDGFSTTVSLNHPLNGTGQDTIGLATTLPISERASVTVKADQINIDPIISATVESKITEQLTASASFNNIRRPNFNLELVANYQIDNHWSTNASFNVNTRQLNAGATYNTRRGFDATVKVDDIANLPQLGVGLGLELSASTRLELSSSHLTTDPTFGVKAIFSF